MRGGELDECWLGKGRWAGEASPFHGGHGVELKSEVAGTEAAEAMG
jgi:hypothetical protein